MSLISKSLENIFNENRLENAEVEINDNDIENFALKFGIKNSDIDLFNRIIENDLKGDNLNNVESTLDKTREYIVENNFSIKQISYLKELSKLTIQKFNLKKSTIFELNELSKLNNIQNANPYGKNDNVKIHVKKDIGEYTYMTAEVYNKIKNHFISKKNQVDINKYLNDNILPEKVRLNTYIEFDSLGNTPKDFSNLLKEIFENFSEYEKEIELNYINIIITGIQASGINISSENIYSGLEMFLKEDKSLNKYLKSAKELSNSENKQDIKLLNSENYWIIRNILQLTKLSNKIKKSTGKNKLNIGSFSPGGSYGPVYLGQLFKEKENGTLPDLFIGGSAGAIYPTLFLLWEKALEKDEKALQNYINKLNGHNNISAKSLDGLLSLISKDISESDSMLFNGKHIGNQFMKIFSELAKIYKSDNQLDFNSSNFEDLDLPISVISSHKINGKFIPGVFANGDNIVKAISTSANPEIMGYNLISNNNNIYNIEWSDGFHSIGNPIDLAYLLNFNKVKKYEGHDIGDSSDISNNLIKYGTNIDNKTGKLFSDIDFGTMSSLSSFDQENAKMLAQLGYLGRITIFNIDKSLEIIKKSSANNERKNYFKNKILNYIFEKYKVSFQNKTYTRKGKNNLLPKSEIDNSYFRDIINPLLDSDIQSIDLSSIKELILGIEKKEGSDFIDLSKELRDKIENY